MNKQSRPNLYALAFFTALCGAVLVAAYLNRPVCACTLGVKLPEDVTFAEYADAVQGMDVPEDCPKHGRTTE
jgi:hypothetical protein